MHDMAAVLRDVGDESEYDVVGDERAIRVCMHAGPNPARFWHATGAMITEALPDSVTVWMTATSATDLSIFKPLFFGVALPEIGLRPTGTDDGEARGWRHERLHRRAMVRYSEVKPEIRAEFDGLEHQFHTESIAMRRASPTLREKFVQWCWGEAALATERWIARLERHPYAIGHAGYRAMWDRCNAEASLAL